MEKVRPSLHLDLVLAAIIAIFALAKSDDASCGFTFPAYSGCIVPVIGIPADFGANVDLGNYATVNVTGYRASNEEEDPHSKYIRGTYDDNNNLKMTTTESFPQFIKEQDTTTINAGFIFNCTDGSEVNCSYRVPLFTDDKFTPQFSNTLFNLTITQDWNTDKAINKNQVIMAVDEDTDFTYSSLTFLMSPASIDITSIPLWVGEVPKEGSSYYMLELYLPAMVLPVGTHEFELTAESTSRRGKATVVLNIIDSQVEFNK